ncbi:MAG: hypothetical protein OEZ51_12605 [Nitrospinota bacterium]|nr:hypothetical protein [Nitrospinota bacterium]
MREFLVYISITGILLFGSVFSLTYMDPERIEQSAKGWVAQEIERKIKSDFPQLFTPEKKEQGAKVLQKLQGHLEKKIVKLREILFSDLPDRIAESVARSCTCRMQGQDREEIHRKYEDTRSFVKGLVVVVLKSGIDKSLILVDRAEDLIQGHYLNIIEKLMLDIRIFSGTNTLLFLLILSIMIIKRDQERPLMVAGGLLTVVTLVSAGIYVFGQNWFYTLMFNNYMGWGYVTLVGVILAFLLDVIFNKGRVSKIIMKGLEVIITPLGGVCP